MKYADSTDLESLLKVVKKLRGPEGCPWDREQTRESLKGYLIEECYEVLDAIDSGSGEKLKEELGDVLFQIIFLAEMSEEEGDFNIFDVINSAREKMITRHPHVFDGQSAKDSKEVKKTWRKIKEKERGGKGSALDSIPDSLPSLLRTFKITKRADHAGFDWGNVDEVFDKLEKDIEDLRKILKKENRESLEAEIGVILFSLVNLGRFLEINPEEALRKEINKFVSRFIETERR